MLCFIKLQILARISSFSLLRSQYNFCSGLRTWKFWQILLTLLNISVLISGYKLTFFFSFPYHLGIGLWCLTPLSTILQLSRGGQFYWWRKPTGTCFIQKIYAPSSSLLLNKEEEGAYIFWMKQVPVRKPEYPEKTTDFAHKSLKIFKKMLYRLHLAMN